MLRRYEYEVDVSPRLIRTNGGLSGLPKLSVELEKILTTGVYETMDQVLFHRLEREAAALLEHLRHQGFSVYEVSTGRRKLVQQFKVVPGGPNSVGFEPVLGDYHGFT